MNNPNYQEILQKLRHKWTVITPNNRLAKCLLEDFLQNAPESVIEKPNCWAYEAFVHTLYLQLTHQQPTTNHPILLTKQQVQYLWAKQLSSAHENVHQGFIKEVIQSWSRCQLFHVSWDHAEWDYTEQTQRFRTWCQTFNQYLKKENFITTELIVPYLIQNNLVFDNPMIWFCFDDATPQQMALQRYLADRGVIIEQLDLSPQSTAPLLFEASNEENELFNIIQFIKDQLAHPTSNDAARRIGIVVPDLNKKANQLNRLLHQHFSPDIFNISLGKTLSDYAIASHALLSIGLNLKTLSQEQACMLLHSPFFACSQHEIEGRMQSLQENPYLQERTIDFTGFIGEITSQTPELAARLNKLKSYPSQASPNLWVNLFQTRLETLGFPGEYPLDSYNYQCYQRLILLFDEFKQYTLLTDAMSAQEAIQTFSRLASTTIFQPEKRTSASVHILGLLEAAGCQFDALWISHMTDEYLPQKTRFASLIPIPLQKTMGFPYTSPDKEYALAQGTVSRFIKATTQIVFSYPFHSGDQSNISSPLLSEFSLIPYPAPMPTPANQTATSIPEYYEETYEIPIHSARPYHGSTALLGNQAKCPFRAFAAHRLHLQSKQEISEGLNLRERGIIIHRIMELFWTEIGTQQNLLNYNEDALAAFIDKITEKALRPYQTRRRHSFTPLIQTIEKSRLSDLVRALLIWEKKRPPFTITSTEASYTLQLGSIDFKVRIDRLDTLETGEQWVIDYKTRMPSKMPWNEDTPTEPQLLLYALLDERINTILFTELKQAQVACKGLSEVNYQIEGIKNLGDNETWTQLKNQWHHQLSELATAFEKGLCEPSPRDSTFCNECDYTDVCRLPFRH